MGIHKVLRAEMVEIVTSFISSFDFFRLTFAIMVRLTLTFAVIIILPQSTNIHTLLFFLDLQGPTHEDLKIYIILPGWNSAPESLSVAIFLIRQRFVFGEWHPLCQSKLYALPDLCALS